MTKARMKNDAARIVGNGGSGRVFHSVIGIWDLIRGFGDSDFGFSPEVDT
jgi:hypothetical protein